MAIRHFSTTTRKEIDVELQLKEGAIPNDLCGFIFINSAAGTVNSNGVPFPKNNADGTENQEYATPLINGDGMVYRIDLTQPGKIHVKTGLMKPPCYYADLATTYDSKNDNPYYKFHFESNGLARLSSTLGTRNELNTAITPVRFKNDNQYRLLANFDAGRPYEFDPKNFSMITAIGENKKWHSGLPPMLVQPFPMILTTAHPVFDPDTEELFTVNFTKDLEGLMAPTTIMGDLFKDLDWLKSELKKLINDVKDLRPEEQRTRLGRFLGTAHLNAPNANKTWFQKLMNLIKRIFHKWYYKHISNTDDIYVIKWNGTKELHRWRIVDENGKGILIQHNMHQLSLSRDYLILGDTNFKFTLDGMMNFPFVNDAEIDRFTRELLTGPMNDYSSFYIVKRADLVPGVETVKAVKAVLPEETVHFSANYDNPDNLITLHTAHNCSACAAEWLRTYDIRQVEPNIPMDEEFLGLVSMGEVDISKIGKVVLNPETGALLEPESVFLELTGDLDAKDPGPHTWSVGLYTYNNMLSSDCNVAKIEYVYWQAYGLHKAWLTQFIYNLYKDPKRNRTYSAEEMEVFTAKGANFVLECIETNTMQATDYFTFPDNHYYWSLQFAPKKNKSTTVHDGKNGYILTTVICGEVVAENQISYNAEIWLFDAANLKSGPICKLNHPELSFGFTIHSVWTAEANEVSKAGYVLNVKEDYDYMVAQIPDTKLRNSIQQFFDEKVYPFFPNK